MDLRAELTLAEAEMDRVQKPVEDANEACPECGKPLLIRTGRFGRFISCSGYPDCTFKKPFMTKTGAICPQDGGDLVERKSRKSAKVFYGCGNYPTCTFAVWDRPLPLPCPECGGLLTIGNGKTEAACYACGAVVRGALDGVPEVIGHRTPEALRPRPARRTSADGDGATAESAEGTPTRARRTAVAATRAPASRVKSTTTRATRTATRTTKTATGVRRTTTTTRAKSPTTTRAKTTTAKTTGAARSRVGGATTRKTITLEPAAS